MRFLFIAPAALALACAGATDDDDIDVTPTCAITLAPSDDDQTAVQTALIEAAAGSMVCFEAGTYTFNTELSLSSDGVTLRGAGPTETILDFAAQDVGANGITITGNDVSVEDLQVRDTPGDGIRATEVNNIAFRNVHVIWQADASETSGAYGLYPVGCTGVLIDRCTVKGARDAGIYVGQSTRILVANSEAYGNVAGIEIENSTDAEVRDNHAHDNTAGILVFNLPGLPIQDGKRAKVHNNLIENNNLANFGEPGTVVADLPPGLGIMILASDGNEFHDNTITGNKTTASLTLGYSRPVFGDHGDDQFDEFAEGNWIHDNTFSNNGSEPVGVLAGYIPDRPIPDLVFDGCTRNATPTEAERNCYSNNGEVEYFDVDICNFFANQNTDLAAVTCEHGPLPAIEDPLGN